jgi:hypothetical protein
MKTLASRYVVIIGIVLFLIGTSCGFPTWLPVDQFATSTTNVITTSPAIVSSPQPTLGAPSQTATTVYTNTPLPTQTAIPTATNTSSTPTSTTTSTLAITPTPTFAFPRITASMQANCRYGPGTAYLYAHGMYPGDGGTVWGRNYAGTWLWIQPDNIEYQCWISISVVEVQGDIFSVAVAPVRLPHQDLYGPPETVSAVRDGEQVTVTWSEVPMTVDDFRGYLLEVTVCQDGSLVSLAVHTETLSYVFTDEQTCDEDSSGLLYTVDKHGYSDPVEIPWP